MQYWDLPRLHSELVETLAARESIETVEAEVTNVCIQRFLDGADESILRTELDANFEPGLAKRIFETATAKYSAAKEAGTLHELQHDIYFSGRPSVARRELAAVVIIALGLLLSAISYYFTARGVIHTLYAGAVAYGVWLLITG